VGILHRARNILDGVFRFADYVDIPRDCAWWIIILTRRACTRCTSFIGTSVALVKPPKSICSSFKVTFFKFEAYRKV
jgi:hypothetical protein